MKKIILAIIASVLLATVMVPSAIAATEKYFRESRLIEKEVDMGAIKCAISWHQFKLRLLVEKEALKSLIERMGKEWDEKAERQHAECLKNTLANLELLLSNEAKTQEIINDLQDELKETTMPDS